MKLIAPKFHFIDRCDPPDYKHSYLVVRVTDSLQNTYRDAEVIRDFGGRDGDRQADNAKVAEAQQLAKRLNQESFDQHIRGKTFTRYVTNWYICTDDSEARRLVEIDHTPWDKVKVTPGLEILHTTGEFTFWSDNKITKNAYNLPYGGTLSDAAARWISSIRGSDTGYVEGGILTLTKVARVLGERRLESGPTRGVYARATITEVEVEWTDGTRGKLYEHTAGYFEGYQLDVYQSLDTFKRLQSAPPPASGLTEFPGDEFAYDEQLGFTKRESD